MTRRARARPAKDQLALDFSQDVPPEIELARRLRVSVGLDQSLTAPKVLAQTIAALRADYRQSEGDHHRPAA